MPSSTPLFDLFYRKVKLPDLEKLAEKYDKSVAKSAANGNKSAKEELESKYNPYRLESPQNYSPIYDRIFVLNQKNHNCVGLNCEYYVEGGDVVSVDDRGNRTIIIPFDQIHVKSSPLVDPFHYLSGKYEKYDNQICVIPAYADNNNEQDGGSHESRNCRLQKKVNDPANSSYVDAFFSYLASKLKHKYNVFGAVDYYGVCSGIQNVFKYDINEDLSYLYSIDFFNENLGKRFFILDEYMNKYADEYMNIGSRANKFPITIDENVQIELDDIEELSLCGDIVVECGNEPQNETSTLSCQNTEELIYESKKDSLSSYESSESESESGSESKSESGTKSGSESGSDWETVDEDEDEDKSTENEEENNIYAYIHKFPVQLIFMEKCDGTMDQLIVDGIMDNKDIFAAAFMQVIMTLITYQKAFQFTHNDLHTNNILYKKTDTEYVYYKYNNQIYKVPTYGRIFKIIDFGRSIYRYNGEIYCSDSYSRGADAYGQYNCEPYFNPDKPRIDPNYSFDLARLGSSIFDFLDAEKSDPEIYETISRWCTDDSGKNIVVKSNGEERWPGFRLYKMIALKVHKHLPQAQLAFPIFRQFAVASPQIDEEVAQNWMLNIDSIVL